MQTTLRTLLCATAVLTSVLACRDSKPDPRLDLSTDSTLAQDLEAVADTLSYSGAADVAMSDLPDSTLAPPTSRQPATRSSTAPTMRVSTQSAPPPQSVPAVQSAPPTRSVPPAPSAAPSQPERPRMTPPARANDVEPSIPLNEPRATPCESPTTADQRRCLMSHLARSDAGLDRTYQSLIAELKRRSESGGSGEPASVLQLRTAQRAWLVYRDTECRRRNRGQEGPLWAPVRAECLGEFSGRREGELRDQLAALRR